MTNHLEQRGDAAVLRYVGDGVVRGDAECLEIIGDALGRGADVVVIPAARLADEFFRLRTGMAGAIVQKFVNYRVALAVLGDISAHTAASPALRDFVAEANRGSQTWFISTMDELDAHVDRLRARRPGGNSSIGEARLGRAL